MVPREVRAQAIQAYLQGEGSIQAIAERMGVRRQTLFKWLARYRRTGEVPFRRRGRASRFSEHDRWVLLSLLHAQPNATARSLAQSFASTTGQTRPGTTTVHLTLLELGLIWDRVWHLPQGGLPPLPPEPAVSSPHPESNRLPSEPDQQPPLPVESLVSPPQVLVMTTTPPSSGCRLPTQPAEPAIAHPSRAAYPSDLSDAEWAIAQPLLEKTATTGRPREVPVREILNALRYMARSGCSWRALPHDLPSWKVVAKTYYRWIADQTWDRLNTALRLQIRTRAGKKEQPTAAIVDSQSLKTAGPGEEQGYDGGKKIKGRKRHVLVDTLGMVLALVVHTAGLIDEQGARLLFQPELKEAFPTIQLVFADSGYRSPARAWVKETLGWELTVVPRKEKTGFHVLPKRWIVERTWGWLNHFRRLSKDYERTTASARAWVLVAMSQIMLHRLA